MEKLNLIMLDLGNRCNYKCIFCNNPFMDKKTSIDIKNFEYIFEQTDKLDIAGYGEILCHPNFYEIIKLLTEKKVRFSFSTNGYALTKDKINLIKQSSIYRMNVSLNSLNPDTYKFLNGETGDLYKVLGNFEELIKNRNFELTISFVLSKMNIGEVENFVLFGKKHSVDYVRFLTLIPVLRYIYPLEFELTGNDNERQLLANAISLANNIGIKVEGLTCFESIALKKEKLQSCKAPWIMLCINGSTGIVTPCCWLGNMNMGNIFEDSIETIWHNDKYLDLRNSILKGNLKYCKDCKEFG